MMNKLILLTIFLVLKINTQAQVYKLVSLNESPLNIKSDTFIPKKHKTRYYEKEIAHLGASFIMINGSNSNDMLNSAPGFSLKLGLNTISKVNIPLSLYLGLSIDYLFINNKKTSNSVFKTDLNSDAFSSYLYTDFDLDFSENRDKQDIVLFGTTFCGFRNYTDNLLISYSDTSKNSKSTKIISEKSFIYGYGGGIKINGSSGSDKFGIRGSIEFRYQKYFGNNTKSIDVNSLVFDSMGNLKSYKVLESNFDYDQFSVGLLLNF